MVFRNASIVAFLFLAGCHTAGPKKIYVDFNNWNSQAPGTIVEQTSEALGNNFYEVAQSIVNPADHWEGVRHTTAIFYGNLKICDCNSANTVISPDGKYIVYFSHKLQRLELLNTRSKKTVAVSDKYIGYPKTADWDVVNGTALLRFDQPDGKDVKDIQINLN